MTHSKSCWKRMAVVTALLATSVAFTEACSDATGGPGPGSTASDDDPFGRPDLVQRRITQERLLQGVWIPGTRLIAGQFPTAGDFCSLALIDVDALSVTPVAQDAVCGATDLSSISVSPDGTMLYYLRADSLTGTSPRIIRRLTIAGLNTADVISLSAGAESFTLSPDGREIVYTAYDADSVGFRLRELATGHDTLLVPANQEMYLWEGARFSPNGSELLFVDSMGIRLRRLTIASGATQFVAGRGLARSSLAWTIPGIQYVGVVSPCHTICERLTNAMTGQGLDLYGDEATVAWSADGLHVAGATAWCKDFGCSQERTEVVVGDWATHGATVIARENSFGVVGLVVSPDGGMVIYGVGSGTYVWSRT